MRLRPLTTTTTRSSTRAWPTWPSTGPGLQLHEAADLGCAATSCHVQNGTYRRRAFSTAMRSRSPARRRASDTKAQDLINYAEPGPGSGSAPSDCPGGGSATERRRLRHQRHRRYVDTGDIGQISGRPIPGRLLLDPTIGWRRTSTWRRRPILVMGRGFVPLYPSARRVPPALAQPRPKPSFWRTT